MIKKHKYLLLDVIGIFFLVLGIVAIGKSMFRQTPTQILYMCYIGLIIIGIGVLTKRSYIVMSQVYILAIPLLVWNIDFIYWLISNKPLWGITDYFFLEQVFTLDKFVTLQHLYSVPLAIYAAHLIGVKRRDAWIWSFIQITLVYVLVTLLSTSDSNINCVFNPCINVYFGLPYRLTWFLIIFSMVGLSALVINNVFLKKHFVGKR
jgi:hypothetical protein